MSKGFAIHNAITDHGGMVPSTQMKSSQMGNLFVRAGDGHVCPKCRCWSTVIKSHDHVIFDGKPVAYVGDKLSCGLHFYLNKVMLLVRVVVLILRKQIMPQPLQKSLMSNLKLFLRRV